MKTNLSELIGLSEADLQQLNQLLDQFPYRKATKMASQKFNRTISVGTLIRFGVRSSPKDFLDDCEHTKETAAQILHFAASGEPQFTEASVHVLEQTAFKLTFTCTQRTEDMQALSQIQTMLFRHRNAVVRERTAAVQQQKLKLREREITLKQTLGTARVSRANEGVSPEQSSETKPAPTWRVIEPYKSQIDALWLECGENKEKFLEAFASKLGQRGYSITRLSSDDWSKEKNEAIHLARLQQDAWYRQKDAEESARRAAARSGGHPCLPVSGASCPADSAPTQPTVSKSLNATTIRLGLTPIHPSKIDGMT
jgi:hypothetical protein